AVDALLVRAAGLRMALGSEAIELGAREAVHLADVLRGLRHALERRCVADEVRDRNREVVAVIRRELALCRCRLLPALVRAVHARELLVATAAERATHALDAERDAAFRRAEGDRHCDALQG